MKVCHILVSSCSFIYTAHWHPSATRSPAAVVSTLHCYSDLYWWFWRSLLSRVNYTAPVKSGCQSLTMTAILNIASTESYIWLFCEIYQQLHPDSTLSCKSKWFHDSFKGKFKHQIISNLLWYCKACKSICKRNSQSLFRHLYDLTLNSRWINLTY